MYYVIVRFASPWRSLRRSQDRTIYISNLNRFPFFPQKRTGGGNDNLNDNRLRKS